MAKCIFYYNITFTKKTACVGTCTKLFKLFTKKSVIFNNVINVYIIIILLFVKWLCYHFEMKNVYYYL